MRVEQAIVLAGDGPPSRAMVRVGTTGVPTPRSESNSVNLSTNARRGASALPTTFYGDGERTSGTVSAALPRSPSALLQQLFAAAPDRRKGLYIDAYA